MKICYIGDGNSIHNHFMVDWFRSQGHDILFLTDTPDHAPESEVIQVAPRHGLGPLRHLYAAANVRKAIENWRPDIVHAHNVTGYGFWGGLTGFKPLVMTAWGTDLNVFAHKNPFVRFMVSFSLRRADLITADAEALCTTARSFAGKNPDIRLLQWGVDLKQFDVSVSEEERNYFRWTADFVFLSNRRLRSLYNIDIILRSFAQALPFLSGSRLVIAGQDILYDELMKLATGLGIDEQVLFTGWLERDRLIAALLSADTFVSVPSTDSTALSLLEAFAARLPVIVTDLPANREWVTHKENGLLVQAGDVNDLSEAMIYIREHWEEAKTWGEKNRDIVVTRGSREKELQKLLSWYEDLCSKRSISKS